MLRTPSATGEGRSPNALRIYYSPRTPRALQEDLKLQTSPRVFLEDLRDQTSPRAFPKDLRLRERPRAAQRGLKDQTHPQFPQKDKLSPLIIPKLSRQSPRTIIHYPPSPKPTQRDFEAQRIACKSSPCIPQYTDVSDKKCERSKATLHLVIQTKNLSLTPRPKRTRPSTTGSSRSKKSLELNTLSPPCVIRKISSSYESPEPWDKPADQWLDDKLNITPLMRAVLRLDFEKVRNILFQPQSSKNEKMEGRYTARDIAERLFEDAAVYKDKDRTRYEKIKTTRNWLLKYDVLKNKDIPKKELKTFVENVNPVFLDILLQKKDYSLDRLEKLYTKFEAKSSRVVILPHIATKAAGISSNVAIERYMKLAFKNKDLTSFCKFFEEILKRTGDGHIRMESWISIFIKYNVELHHLLILILPELKKAEFEQTNSTTHLDVYLHWKMITITLLRAKLPKDSPQESPKEPLKSGADLHAKGYLEKSAFEVAESLNYNSELRKLLKDIKLEHTLIKPTSISETTSLD